MPSSPFSQQPAGAPTCMATISAGNLLVWQPVMAARLPEGFSAWSLSPDGALIAIGLANGEIRVIHIESEATICSVQAPSQMPVTAITFSPDQRLLLAGTHPSDDADGPSDVLVYAIAPNPPAPETVCRLRYRIDCLAMSPDNLLVAVGGSNHRREGTALSVVNFYGYHCAPVSAPRWEPTREVPLFYEGQRVVAVLIAPDAESATVMFSEPVGVCSVTAQTAHAAAPTAQDEETDNDRD